MIGFALGISVAEQLRDANTARQAIRLPRWFFGRQIAIGLVAFQQIMAAFAADSAFDEAIALWATLRSQGNFSLRAGADDHFNSFLEQFRLGPGSNERRKLAEGSIILKRLATTLLQCSLWPDHYQQWLLHDSATKSAISLTCRDHFLRSAPLCSRRLMDASH